MLDPTVVVSPQPPEMLSTLDLDRFRREFDAVTTERGLAAPAETPGWTERCPGSSHGCVVFEEHDPVGSTTERATDCRETFDLAQRSIEDPA